jgi:hypothetical protein
VATGRGRVVGTFLSSTSAFCDASHEVIAGLAAARTGRGGVGSFEGTNFPVLAGKDTPERITRGEIELTRAVEFPFFVGVDLLRPGRELNSINGIFEGIFEAVGELTE